MTALQSVLDKISRIDCDKPYFWRLLIDAEEYDALWGYVRQELGRGKVTAIRSIPLPIMVYIAEWYKREYDGCNSPSDLKFDSSDLAMLWHASGIDIEKFVASDETSHRWLYSIYVLGGLAARYEMHRGDDGRFLRKLCRLFHGEEIEISVGEQNALAFRRSIAEEQSLFEYLREIFNGSMPVAESDLTPGNLFTEFRQMIVNANIRALAKADKFVMSPALIIIPESDMARLMIVLHMCPEEIGCGCHCYIRYDRMLAWGFRNPDKVATLKLSLRFLNKAIIIKDVDFDHPLRQWSHTGWRESGMICRGDNDIFCHDVPCVPFDTVEAVMRASTGEEQLVGRWHWPGYARLRLADPRRQLWMTGKGNSKETGVVYSDDWIPEPSMGTQLLTLIDADDEPTEHSVNWSKIDEPFVLTNGSVTTDTFLPSGSDMKLHLKRYPNLIHYNEEGTFRVTDRMSDPRGMERELPAIFYRSDIMIKNLGDDGISLTEPDCVEYMKEGRYQIWDGMSSPDKGVLRLRVKSGGRHFVEDVIYLSPVNDQTPVCRDFTTCSLIYRSEGKENVFKDSLELSERITMYSVDLEFSENGASVNLPLLRPVIFRQWIMDGLTGGNIDEDIFKLPWILRDRVRLVSLTEYGVEEYDCSRLKKFDVDNRNFMYRWTEGKATPAIVSDPEAPQWLQLILGDRPPRKETDYMFWNMESGSKPVERFLTEKFNERGIGFKSPDSIHSPEYPFPYLHIDESPDWDDDFWREDNEETETKKGVQPLEVFLTACRYQSYFFIFPQLTESRWLDQSNLREALIEPLRVHDGGRISEIHLKGLERLTAETYLSIDLDELRK